LDWTGLKQQIKPAGGVDSGMQQADARSILADGVAWSVFFDSLRVILMEEQWSS
jgi:hypothetical protein